MPIAKVMEPFEPLWDKSCYPMSYHAGANGHTLLALDLLIRFEGISYTLTVETPTLHAARVAVDIEELPEDDQPADYAAYIVSAEQLLPEHIVALRGRPFRELQHLLIEQVVSEEEND